MKAPGEIAYESWCENAGIPCKTPYERALDNQPGELFTELMNNHMIAGFFRYGSIATYRDNPIDFASRIKQSLGAFERDGNIEHFVDAGNWARLGFLYAEHENRHYTVSNKKR